MATELNLVSNLLRSHYVFYNRLNAEDESEDNKKLYEIAKNKMSMAAEQAASVKMDTNFIYQQAEKERQKELALIEKMTSIRPAAKDWVDESKNIIEAINLCISSKDIYERVYQTITKNGKTQGKGVFSFFGGYLQSTINDKWPEFTKRLKRVNALDIPEDVILDWLRTDVLPIAIQKMFDAQPEDGVDPELQSAYQELSKLAGTFNQTGSFAQQMAKIYNLDEVAGEIKKIISTRENKRKPGTISSLSNNAKLTYSRGGYTLEALVDLMVENALISDGKSGHANIGNLQAKADNVFTIGIDCSEIANFLEERETGTRELNTKAFMELGHYLNKFQEGFVVYTSDKNYTLNDGFKRRGGFSVGTDLSLRQYDKLMETAGKNAHTFIGAIEQLAKGAVGDDQDQTDYADIISKNIAYLLFDDFNTIGTGLTNGPATIHLMNLNGMFIPISSILFALGDAITKEENINNIVKTNIILPKIRFDTEKSQRDWEAKNGRSAWWEQREIMLDTGKIQTHFLGNLKQLLSNERFR